MGSNLMQCDKCQDKALDLNLIQFSHFKDAKEIQNKFKRYVEVNHLADYPSRALQNIQKLFIINQIDLCNLLVLMLKNNHHEKLDKMFSDLQNIVLEQLDHLALIEVLPRIIQKEYQKINKSLQETSKEDTGQDEEQQAKKEQFKLVHKYSIKINKKNINKIIKVDTFFMIVPIGCFYNIDIFKQTKLLTKKSLLKIFIEKVQAINIKYRLNFLVIFIVNPLVQKEFDKLMEIYACQQKEEVINEQFQLYGFNYQKILYKPLYPCLTFLNNTYKLKVTGQEQIFFNYQTGDLIGFIKASPLLQNIMQKYAYFHIININNMLEHIGQYEIFNYLNKNHNVDIIANIVTRDQLSFGFNTLKLCDRFVVKAENTKHSMRKSLELTNTFYVRTSLFLNNNAYFTKMISTKIKSQPWKNQIETISFVRVFQHILYAPITTLIIVPNTYLNHSQNPEKVYSQHCKYLLQIKDTTEQQIVQICPQILFGPNESFQKILQALSKHDKIGFPLIINKQIVSLDSKTKASNKKKQKQS